MGFRFRKSVKIAPGVKVNFGKKSVGMSIGNRYAGVSVNSRTGARARVSAPGTGLSYSTKISSSAAPRADRAPLPTQPVVPSIEQRQSQPKMCKVALMFTKYIYPLLAAVCVLIGYAVPICFGLAALLLYVSIKQTPKYEAEQIMLEQPDSQIMEGFEDALGQTGTEQL